MNATNKFKFLTAEITLLSNHNAIVIIFYSLYLASISILSNSLLSSSQDGASHVSFKARLKFLLHEV